MLPKAKRVPRKLFGTLIQSKKFIDTKHFSVRIAPSDVTRIAVAVSKRVSKKAVVRNKIRRRTYFALRELLLELPRNLFLLVAKPSVSQTKVDTIKKELAEALIKG